MPSPVSTPRTLSYIETHGTGTALGDPIEIAALTNAFQGQAEAGACAIGSLKTNVGHLDAAAGSRASSRRPWRSKTA